MVFPCCLYKRTAMRSYDLGSVFFVETRRDSSLQCFYFLLK